MVTNKLGMVLKMQRAGQVEAVSNFKPGLIWGKCTSLETGHIFFLWNYAMMGMGPSYSMKTYFMEPWHFHEGPWRSMVQSLIHIILGKYH